jgi:hypothetical protein
VHEDDLSPVSLFDREEDPNQERDLIVDRAGRRSAS